MRAFVYVRGVWRKRERDREGRKGWKKGWGTKTESENIKEKEGEWSGKEK